MGDIRVLYGRDFNALERAALVTTSSRNPLYQVRELWSGQASQPFIFGAAGADEWAMADLDRLGATGGMDTWDGGSNGNPIGWVKQEVGGGHVSQEPAIKHSGAFAAKLSCTAAGDVALIQRDFTVKAGSEQNADVWLGSSGGSVNVRMQVQDRCSGRFLSPAGLWLAGPIDFAVITTAATLVNIKATFTTLDYLTLYNDTTQLRITFLVKEPGAGYVDDVTVFPTVDFLGLFGLPNLDASIGVEWRSDASAFGGQGTLVGNALPVRRPGLYAIAPAPVRMRYTKIILRGTNLGIGQPFAEPAIGELVLGKSTALLSHGQPPEVTRYRSNQVTNETSGGEVRRFARQPYPQRVAKLPVTFVGLPQFQEMRDMRLRTESGVYPVVLVPDDADPEVCLFGQLQDAEWEVAQQVHHSLNVREGELVVVEDPFPVLLSP